METTPPLTVYASWRGLVSAIATPVLMAAFGAYAIAGFGPAPLPVVILVLGLGLAAVTLWDYPRRAEFHLAGVDRVCFLRTQHLPWSTLVAIERPRASVLSQIKLKGADKPLRPPSGGLVARASGKRRYLLTDRIESQLEFDALARLLREAEAPTVVRAPRPGPDAPPTDLYRRRARGGTGDRP